MFLHHALNPRVLKIGGASNTPNGIGTFFLLYHILYIPNRSLAIYVGESPFFDQIQTTLVFQPPLVLIGIASQCYKLSDFYPQVAPGRMLFRRRDVGPVLLSHCCRRGLWAHPGSFERLKMSMDCGFIWGVVLMLSDWGFEVT